MTSSFSVHDGDAAPAVNISAEGLVYAAEDDRYLFYHLPAQSYRHTIKVTMPSFH